MYEVIDGVVYTKQEQLIPIDLQALKDERADLDVTLANITASYNQKMEFLDNQIAEIESLLNS